jgi:hypothetical protein
LEYHLLIGTCIPQQPPILRDGKSTVAGSLPSEQHCSSISQSCSMDSRTSSSPVTCRAPHCPRRA